MLYKIDNVDISTFGAKPIKTSQYFALTGFYDLPRRIGNTEHDWGTEIEPFVEKEDIEIDGRRLTLNVLINASMLDAFITACVNCKELSMHDGFVFKKYDVVCKDEIKVVAHDEHRIVEVPFWEEKITIPELSISGTATQFARLAIDEYDMHRDFSTLMTRHNNLTNEAKRIEIKTTEFYTKTSFRSTREVEIVCFMHTNNLIDAHFKINQLHALLYKPGMRELRLRDEVLNVYFKNGLECQVINERLIKFTLKATVV